MAQRPTLDLDDWLDVLWASAVAAGFLLAVYGLSTGSWAKL